MMAAIAPPAARTVRALIQNRLIIARYASAAPSLIVSRFSIEEGARSKGWRVCISIVIFKILYSELIAGVERCPCCGRSAGFEFKAREDLSIAVSPLLSYCR